MSEKRKRGRPRGSSNPNAGNRPKDPDNPLTERVWTLVSKQTAAKLDTLRGTRKRSDIVREAIEQWVRSQEDKT